MDAGAWDARYQDTPRLWGDEPAPGLADLLAGLATRSGAMVDLAGGDGRHAAWLARRGWRTTVVDFSAVALEQGEQQARAEGLEMEFVRADVERWSPPRAVDAVVVAYLHLPVDRLQGVLARAAGWLAPGGVLAYLGHARENASAGYGGPPEESVLPTLAQLAEAVQGWQVSDLRHVLREVPDGHTAIDVRALAGPWDAESVPAALAPATSEPAAPEPATPEPAASDAPHARR